MKGAEIYPQFFSLEVSLLMMILLLWSSVKKMCVGTEEGLLYANRIPTEYNPPLPRALTYLFLVDCNYLKFLETLAIWEEKKIPCGFPISLPVWTGAEKTESYSTYLLN